jgi:hypothetical protein
MRKIKAAAPEAVGQRDLSDKSGASSAFHQADEGSKAMSATPGIARRSLLVALDRNPQHLT